MSGSEVGVGELVQMARARYREAPFAVSGFAWWKVEKAIQRAQCYTLQGEGMGPAYCAVANNKLLFYLSPGHDLLLPRDGEPKTFDLLHLHSRYAHHLVALEPSHAIHSYRPMRYRPGTARYSMPARSPYELRTLDMAGGREAGEIARVISASSGGNLTDRTVESWSKEPVYAPALWIGAFDRVEDALVGVGISTFNNAVSESDLDWFYVAPEHQGKGVGSLLVGETIRRCQGKSAVIRVSGVADGFYRKCGFESQDEWHYITRKGVAISWWDEPGTAAGDGSDAVGDMSR